MNRQLLFSNILVGLVVGGMMLTFQAMADNNHATDNLERVVPYQGVLEFNGQAWDGPIDIRFGLFNDAQAGVTDDCAPANENCEWSEEWTAAGNGAVTVYQGRFAVELGRHVPITEVVYDAEALYLGMEVKPPGAPDWIALANRQRINPVPYALWSAQSSNHNVAGNLTVDSAADVAGNLTVGGTATIDSALSVGGPISDPNSNVIIDGNVNVTGFLDAEDVVEAGELRRSGQSNLRYEVARTDHSFATFSSADAGCSDNNGCALFGLNNFTPVNSFCWLGWVQSNAECRIFPDGQTGWRGRARSGICGINCFRYRQ